MGGEHNLGLGLGDCVGRGAEGGVQPGGRADDWGRVGEPRVGDSLGMGTLGLAPALAGHGLRVALVFSAPGWEGKVYLAVCLPLSWPQGLEGKWGFTCPVWANPIDKKRQQSPPVVVHSCHLSSPFMGFQGMPVETL